MYDIQKLHVKCGKSDFHRIMLDSLVADIQETQIIDDINGKKVNCIIAGHTPEKLAWYYGNLKTCNVMVKDKLITKASSFRGIFQIRAGKVIILFSEGVELKYHPKHTQHSDKHQLLIMFEDCSMLSASVKAYGGIWCYYENEMTNPYFGLNSPII